MSDSFISSFRSNQSFSLGANMIVSPVLYLLFSKLSFIKGFQNRKCPSSQGVHSDESTYTIMLKSRELVVCDDFFKRKSSKHKSTFAYCIFFKFSCMLCFLRALHPIMAISMNTIIPIYFFHNI